MKKVLIIIALIFLPIIYSHAYVTDNTLAIPSLGISQRIAELPTINGLGNYIWRRPNSSTPDAGGNTVFIAHRMVTIPVPVKATFGKLPSAKVGDLISIKWKGIDYKYKVYETKTVDPSAIEVEYNTDKPIVTLYTCVYTLTGKLRFIVRAEKI